jgi:hypothetical protein
MLLNMRAFRSRINWFNRCLAALSHASYRGGLILPSGIVSSLTVSGSCQYLAMSGYFYSKSSSSSYVSVTYCPSFSMVNTYGFTCFFCTSFSCSETSPAYEDVLLPRTSFFSLVGDPMEEVISTFFSIFSFFFGVSLGVWGFYSISQTVAPNSKSNSSIFFLPLLFAMI